MFNQTLAVEPLPTLMLTNQQPVFLCVLRGYNHQYFEQDADCTDPLWKHLTERFVAARDHDRAKWLFIQTLIKEAFPMPDLDDCRIQANNWTSEWQQARHNDDSLRMLITDPQSQLTHA